MLAAQAACSGFVIAAERPAAAANAAVVYWQAFALLPEPLAEPEKAKYEAAVANPAAPVADDLAPIIAKFDDALTSHTKLGRRNECRPLRRGPPARLRSLVPADRAGRVTARRGAQRAHPSPTSR